MKNIGKLGGYKRSFIVAYIHNKNDGRVTDHAWSINNISIKVARQVNPIKIEQIRFCITDKLDSV